MHERFAQTKEINLVRHLLHKAILMADVEILRVVVRNLLSSALKFPPTQGRFSIRELTRPQCLSQSISDLGRGVIIELTKKIVKVDWVYGEAGTSGEKGAGLGLRSVLGFATSQGWKFNPINTLGIGTSMHLTIPLYHPEIKSINQVNSNLDDLATLAFAISN